MTGHNIETGHRCPKCGRGMVCTIEDGYCAVGGEDSYLCDTCLRQSHFDAMTRDDYDDR